MPTSDNITVPYKSNIIDALAPNSALDIGVGMGRFGFFFENTVNGIAHGTKALAVS
jgi:hypothetical protein